MASNIYEILLDTYISGCGQLKSINKCVANQKLPSNIHEIYRSVYDAEAGALRIKSDNILISPDGTEFLLIVDNDGNPSLINIETGEQIIIYTNNNLPEYPECNEEIIYNITHEHVTHEHVTNNLISREYIKETPVSKNPCKIQPVAYISKSKCAPIQYGCAKKKPIIKKRVSKSEFKPKYKITKRSAR